MNKIKLKDIFTKKIIIFIFLLSICLILFGIFFPSWNGAIQRAKYSNIKSYIAMQIRELVIEPNIDEFYSHQNKNNPDWKAMYKGICIYYGETHNPPCINLDYLYKYRNSKNKSELEKLKDLIVSYQTYLDAKDKQKRYAGCVLYKIDKLGKYTEKDKRYSIKLYYVDQSGDL